MDSLKNSYSVHDAHLDDITNQLEEGLAVKFTEEELHAAGQEFENSLIIKLVGNRGYNRAALKTVLRELWKSIHGLKFTELEGNALLAKFHEESDMVQVTSKGPWRFMGWALQVVKWSPGKHISEFFDDTIQLWVQIHNLPVEYRNNQFAVRFAQKAGKVIQVADNKFDLLQIDEVRKYVKFKVEIDLSKPVVPGWTLDQGPHTPLWINFKYERLPNICFTCGKFDHETRLCSNSSGSNHPTTVTPSRFGPWLRVEHIAIERLMNQKSSPEFGRNISISENGTPAGNLNSCDGSLHLFSANWKDTGVMYVTVESEKSDNPNLNKEPTLNVNGPMDLNKPNNGITDDLTFEKNDTRMIPLQTAPPPPMTGKRKFTDDASFNWKKKS